MTKAQFKKLEADPWTAADKLCANPPSNRRPMRHQVLESLQFADLIYSHPRGNYSKGRNGKCREPIGNF